MVVNHHQSKMALASIEESNNKRARNNKSGESSMQKLTPRRDMKRSAFFLHFFRGDDQFWHDLVGLALHLISAVN